MILIGSNCNMTNKAVLDAGFSAAGPTHKLSRLVLKKRVYSSSGCMNKVKKYALIMLVIMVYIY